MDRTEELKSRVEAKKAQLIATLTQMKADAQGKGNDAGEAIQQHLTKLNDSLKDGWDNVSETVVNRLNAWLKEAPESSHQPQA